MRVETLIKVIGSIVLCVYPLIAGAEEPEIYPQSFWSSECPLYEINYPGRSSSWTVRCSQLGEDALTRDEIFCRDGFRFEARSRTEWTSEGAVKFYLQGDMIRVRLPNGTYTEVGTWHDPTTDEWFQQTTDAWPRSSVDGIMIRAYGDWVPPVPKEPVRYSVGKWKDKKRAYAHAVEEREHAHLLAQGDPPRVWFVDGHDILRWDHPSGEYVHHAGFAHLVLRIDTESYMRAGDKVYVPIYSGSRQVGYMYEHPERGWIVLSFEGVVRGGSSFCPEKVDEDGKIRIRLHRSETNQAVIRFDPLAETVEVQLGDGRWEATDVVDFTPMTLTFLNTEQDKELKRILQY